VTIKVSLSGQRGFDRFHKVTLNGKVLETRFGHQSNAQNSLPHDERDSNRLLDEIGSRNPKAKSLTPANFIDLTYLKELEQSGFIKSLYGE
jgi:hypothetical protein